MPEFHHRRLPHHYLDGKWLFVTCHLHGSLPQAKYPPRGKLNSGAAFVWIEPPPRYDPSGTDVPSPGSRRGRGRGGATSGSPARSLPIRGLDDHVESHSLAAVAKAATPSRLLQALKGSSAREANRIYAARVSGFGRASRTSVGSGIKRNGNGLRITLRRIL